jgi:histidinol phosphatase-like PHP family hydrolase
MKGNMTPSKNNFPEIDPNLKEIYEVLGKEFEAMILRKPSEVQENTDKHYKKMRKTIQDMNQKFREIKIIRKNQLEILELKIVINEIKYKIASFHNRLEQEEERISELEYRSIELTLS